MAVILYGTQHREMHPEDSGGKQEVKEERADLRQAG
jgi:hypothetical protein